MVQVRRWFNTQPEGIPFMWSAIVVAVFVLFAAPPPGEGATYLDTSHRDSFIQLSQETATHRYVGDGMHAVTGLIHTVTDAGANVAVWAR